MTMPPLGGMSAARFMADHWQKRPLFVPGAVPAAVAVVDVDTLLELATHPDAKTRRVSREAATWSVDHGPLRKRQLLRKGTWTLLVQGLNHFLPTADALLRQFAFIPYTRLDDVMASFAMPGAGVGPHYDSYDVFLIQAHGTRRWQISGQSDRELMPEQPLKLMADFRAEQTFECRPGDLLYLPPGYAHDGVAVEPCITLSVGFRAPSRNELAREFLYWMADHIDLPGLYADPDLLPVDAPAAIDAGLLARVLDILREIHWDEAVVSAFLGQHLSQPESHVVFDPPDEALDPDAFAGAAMSAGVALDLQTLMLHDAAGVYCNGERVPESAAPGGALRRLADRRFLEGHEIGRELAACLHPLYLTGQLHLAVPTV